MQTDAHINGQRAWWIPLANGDRAHKRRQRIDQSSLPHISTLFLSPFFYVFYTIAIVRSARCCCHLFVCVFFFVSLPRLLPFGWKFMHFVILSHFVLGDLQVVMCWIFQFSLKASHIYKSKCPQYSTDRLVLFFYFVNFIFSTETKQKTKKNQYKIAKILVLFNATRLSARAKSEKKEFQIENKPSYWASEIIAQNKN